jgi:hypothetical protein
VGMQRPGESSLYNGHLWNNGDQPPPPPHPSYTTRSCPRYTHHAKPPTRWPVCKTPSTSHPTAPHVIASSIASDTSYTSPLNPHIQKRIIDYYTPQAKRHRIHTTPANSPHTTPIRTNKRTRQLPIYTAPSVRRKHTHTMDTLNHTQAPQHQQSTGAPDASVQPGTDIQPTASPHAALDTQPSPRQDGLGSGCPQQNSRIQSTVQNTATPTAL